MSLTVVAFSGSLRQESYTTKLVKAFVEYAPSDVAVEIIEIGDLPFINEDLESDLPESVKKLHEKVRAADAVLLATPEYNRSYSPVLKNAIDWGSRPDDNNVWDGKPAAVVGQTPYTLGAFGAQNHLRQVMMYVNLLTMQQPEFYVEKAGDKFDATGQLTDVSTREHIEKFWTAFVAWAKKVS